MSCLENCTVLDTLSICHLDDNLTKTCTSQVDEEKKVEAVKDFYENAVGNEKIVERLQFISRYNPYTKELLLILYT